MWAALGAFFEEYLATLEFEGSLDYSELILRAAVLANDPRAGRTLRESFRLIVVDEYQDTDPAQVRAPARPRRRRRPGGGRRRPRPGDLRLPRRGRPGHPALPGRVRRPRPASPPGSRCCGPRDGSRGPSRRRRRACSVRCPLAPLPAQVQRLHRTPVAQDGPAQVEVRTFPTAAAEAAGVAETLLRAHAGRAGDAPGSRGRRWPSSCAIPRFMDRSWRGPCARPGSPCGCRRTRPRSPTSPRSGCCCR